jgi:phage anti-repressor protein
MNLTIFKNEVIPVYETELGNKVVKATELYQFLKVKERYNGWMDRKMKDHQLSENKDYCNFTEKTVKIGKGRKKKEYLIKLDSAKKIAMGTNNIQGNKVKEYFLACERIAKRTFEAVQNIADHGKVSIQKKNSKEVNSYQYMIGGVESVTEYNRLLCKSFTGKFPSEIVKEAKEAGMPSKQRTSGKEVLRNTKPAIACAMSFTDNLVKMGMDKEQALKLTTVHAVAMFEGLLQVGVIPTELSR